MKLRMDFETDEFSVEPLILAVVARRRQLGLSQQDVSDASGVCRSIISHFEMGQKTSIRIEDFTRILYSLGLKIVMESRTLYPRGVQDAEAPQQCERSQSNDDTVSPPCVDEGE